jgi:hypothetical protein
MAESLDQEEEALPISYSRNMIPLFILQVRSIICVGAIKG